MGRRLSELLLARKSVVARLFMAVAGNDAETRLLIVPPTRSPWLLSSSSLFLRKKMFFFVAEIKFAKVSS